MTLTKQVLDALTKRAQRYCSDSNDAADIVQNTCLQLLQPRIQERIRSYSQTRFLRYAYGALYHAYVSLIRKRRGTHPERRNMIFVEDIESLAHSSNGLMEKLVQQETHDYLSSLFVNLPHGSVARDAFSEPRDVVAHRHNITPKRLRARLYEFKRGAKKELSRYFK